MPFFDQTTKFVEEEDKWWTFKLESQQDSRKLVLNCLSWNVQSIRNKCSEVMEHVGGHVADVVFLSETWMRSNNDDITAMVKPYGYRPLHNRRKNRDKTIGGGVGVMIKDSLNCKHLTRKPFSSFEHTMVSVQLNDKSNLITIYRLQYIAKSIFLVEFTELLEIICSNKEIFVLCGDINFHLDIDEPNTLRLK